MTMEILFRGKRLDNGEWVEGDLHTLFDGTVLIISKGAGGFDISHGEEIFVTAHMYEVDPATVGMYTGLTDKNGRKIFDGDVLEVTTAFFGNIEKRRVVVEWDGNIENDSFGEPHTSGYCIQGYDWDVIGNVFDNPELMEATK